MIKWINLKVLGLVKIKAKKIPLESHKFLINK